MMAKFDFVYDHYRSLPMALRVAGAPGEIITNLKLNFKLMLDINNILIVNLSVKK